MFGYSLGRTPSRAPANPAGDKVGTVAMPCPLSVVSSIAARRRNVWGDKINVVICHMSDIVFPTAAGSMFSMVVSAVWLFLKQKSWECCRLQHQHPSGTSTILDGGGRVTSSFSRPPSHGNFEDGKNMVQKIATTASPAYLADFSAMKPPRRSKHSPQAIITAKIESETRCNQKIGASNGENGREYRRLPLITTSRTVLRGHV